MNAAQHLVCLAPKTSPALSLEALAIPRPKPGEILVRVEATSVNPIDVKRASGYGQRLLRLKGAGTFPLVLGNDVVGIVEAVGEDAGVWAPGDRVMGVVPTGSGGAHASHVVVESRWLRRAVEGYETTALAVLPYTFITVWQSLRKAGITQHGARSLEVVVHGASGGLGQLATQLLVAWGASVTAICSTANVSLCERLGATVVWNRRRHALADLPQRFDAALNFGAWEDEGSLINSLKQGAYGYATTVHPLLANFDRHGWLGGAWRSLLDHRRSSTLAAGKSARYRWVVFKPDGEALDALDRFLHARLVRLPVGIEVPLSRASEAFDHIAMQRPGRAALLPDAG